MWRQTACIPPDSVAAHRVFASFCCSHGLYQHVLFTTRTGASLSSTLDLLFSDEPSLIGNMSVTPGISDHDDVLVSIKYQPMLTPRYPQERSISCWKEIIQACPMHYLNFWPSFKLLDMGSQWCLFKTKLLSLIDAFIPTRIFSPKKQNNKPWVNRELHTFLNKKRYAYHQYRMYKSVTYVSRLIFLRK